MSMSISDVAVRFGGLQALAGVGLTVEPGEVVALIGPNGAGKTTLINCVTGFVTPDCGSVLVEGVDVLALRPERRLTAGVGRSFQTPRVDPEATVEENLTAGCYSRTRARLTATLLRLPYQRDEERRVAERVQSLLAEFELRDVAHAPASEVPVWQLRLLEVARTMAMEPRYLLLDEPAAGLDADVRALLARHVRALRDQGVGVLLVEHNFSFVRELSDRVVVLHRGEVLATGTPQEIAADAGVVDVYLGSADDDGR